MTTTTQNALQILGMDCANCAKKLETALATLPGVKGASLTYPTGRLYLDADLTPALREQIAATVEALGYQLEYERGTSAEEARVHTQDWLSRNRPLITIAVMGVLLAAALLLNLVWVQSTLADYLALAAIAVGGIPLTWRTLKALVRTRKIDMDVLMLIAVIGATALGDYAEAAATALLLTIGELLEHLAADRARQEISSLINTAPTEALLLEGDGQRRVKASDLQIGDLVLVRPGERLAVDGVIVEGESALEEAAITGESLPVEKGRGDEVFAGTINGQGALTLRVTCLAQDNILSRIVKLVEQAQARQSRSERFVDRFAAVYTPIVVGVALAIAIIPPLLGYGDWHVWLYRALVPLVVACPCALVISTPVTMVSGLARATKSGVIIKGGSYLERLAQLKVVAFDKTGTLTLGKPRIVAQECAGPHDEENCATCLDLLATAASVERRSEHVLGQAVTEAAALRGVSEHYPIAEDVQVLVGRGIAGRVGGHQVAVGSVSRQEELDDLIERARRAQEAGNTVLVVRDTCCADSCFLTVADELRPSAAEAIRDLRALGIQHTAMLTGDHFAVAERLSKQAGVDQVRAELLPEMKVEAVRGLVERYGQVAMVGDGINDAPALAEAYVGVAMGRSGTDVAVETAGVTLLGDDLRRLPWAIGLAREVMRLVRSNIVLALAIKLVFLVLAFFGLTTLWMAVVADTGSSLLVTANGLRALRYRDLA